MKEPSYVKKILLNALFPPKVACISCGREAVVLGDGMCRDCHGGVELFNDAPPPENVDRYTAVFIYNDVSSRIVKRLKYNNERYLAKGLADMIRIPEEWTVDAVVPVPLYYKKLNKRGFNQSELIARHLCARLGLTLDTSLLVRTRDTESQTQLSDAGRRKNVKEAFAADSAAKDKRILLIDDVRTSGATLASCAAELKKNGAGLVYAATVCMAAPSDED